MSLPGFWRDRCIACPCKAGWLFLFAVLFHFVPARAQPGEKPRKCIMVFGAHADDVESLAGGTLAKYIADGYEGIYVGVVNNLAGCNLERTPYFDPPRFSVSNSPHAYPVGALETSQIREEEARQAAAVLAATPVFLNYNEPWFSMGRKQIDYGTDLFYQYAPPGRPTISLATYLGEEVDFVLELLKKYKPEIVIIHALGGEKHDHGNSAYMMYLAFKAAMQQHVPVGKLWMRADGWLLTNPRGKPDVRIDVKDFLKLKYEAYDKHVSQNGGMGRAYFMRNRQKKKEGVEQFITVLDNMVGD